MILPRNLPTMEHALYAGFDPGSTDVGWAVVRALDGSPVDAGVWRLKGKELHERRLSFATQWVGWEHLPYVMAAAVESQFVGLNPMGALILGEAKGWITMTLLMNGVPDILEFLHQEWKSRFVSGDADKEMVLKVANLEFRGAWDGEEYARSTGTRTQVKRRTLNDIPKTYRHNASDAYGIARAGWGVWNQQMKAMGV